MKIPLKSSSWIAAVLCWTLFSALAVFIFWGMRDRARLIRDNDNERIFSLLFASLRNYDDFGSAIEAFPSLKDRIAGFGIYGNDLRLIYHWGSVPPVFDETELEKYEATRNSRYTIPDRRRRTVKFILHTERMGPPNPPGDTSGKIRRMHQAPWFFNVLTESSYLYIDVFHPAYWRTDTLIAVLFPVCEVLLFCLIFFVRSLYLGNIEYRERIEAQKNLVVLGTAAGTLAHEIKNPLSSIRIQTGILKKILGGAGKEEIAIIDEEVDRLSALIFRVTDYLRDPGGNRLPLNAWETLRAVSERLCGRNILGGESGRDGLILMDEERARSVFENLIRNALESGGDAKDISASVTRNNGLLEIALSDRGKGIAPEYVGRIFDPFFTSKSTGMGIGLSISRRFIEAAGGSITLENREGGGIRVSMLFPEYSAGKDL
jgi:two-component system sensor histidine kinase HydH